MQFAAKGINIVLISRSRTKLENVASEIGKLNNVRSANVHMFSNNRLTLKLDIETKYGVATQIIDVDFTLGAEIYDRIGKELQGLDIGVLVNNVGMSYQYPEYLAQVCFSLVALH